MLQKNLTTFFILQSIHTDKNDTLNQEETNFLNRFVHIEGITDEIRINNYICQFKEFFKINSQKYGKWTICCWLPIISKYNREQNKIPYYQYFVLESLRCVMDISSSNIIDHVYGNGYGSHFLGSSIRHGTAIPVTIDNDIVKPKCEDKGWIPFSWGRSGGPSHRQNNK